MVMGIWVVSKGDAIYIGVYDPKAVDTIEMTVRSGWWAELGLSPLTSMTAPDLDGLAGDEAVVVLITAARILIMS